MIKKLCYGNNKKQVISFTPVPEILFFVLHPRLTKRRRRNRLDQLLAVKGGVYFNRSQAVGPVLPKKNRCCPKKKPLLEKHHSIYCFTQKPVGSTIPDQAKQLFFFSLP
jgi:hypothetical protein